MAEIRPTIEATAPSSPPTDEVSVYGPLRHRLFQWLWIASVASNIGTWMQNVGASWLMTDLSNSSLLVGLVQTATNFPVFILAIPAGALSPNVRTGKVPMPLTFTGTAKKRKSV